LGEVRGWDLNPQRLVYLAQGARQVRLAQLMKKRCSAIDGELGKVIISDH
jgi:hypothetical protein